MRRDYVVFVHYVTQKSIPSVEKREYGFLIHLLESMFDYKFMVDPRKLQAFHSKANEISLSIGTFTTQEGHGGIDSTKINAVLKQINDVDSKLGIESVFLIDADTDQHVNPPGGPFSLVIHFAFAHLSFKKTAISLELQFIKHIE